jgi:hypothetical protein
MPERCAFAPVLIAAPKGVLAARAADASPSPLIMRTGDFAANA